MDRTQKVGVLQRMANFDQSAINEEDRTATIAFSSEEPVSRWDGNEILDHDPKSIRLGRLMDGGPLLVDHDPTDHVGVVESVSVGGDRVGRAVVRFGKSQRATEIFQDVIDGIRKSISVGYRVYSAVTERGDSDEKVYRVNDWEPLEVSFVSIPADVTAKVGRADTPLNTFTITGNKTMTDSVDTPVVEQRAVAPQINIEEVKNEARAQATKDELARVRSINAIAGKFDAGDLARQFAENGRSVAEFKDAVLEKMEGDKPAMRTEQTAEVGLTSDEIRSYSLMRAVNAQATGDWSKAGFEREVSMAAADKYGREARGFWMPDEIKGRAMTTASDGTGLKGVENTGYIDKLYDNSLGIMLGADVLSGLVGDVSVPALTTGGTAYWVAEDADITDADAVVGAVALNPKTVGFAVPISRLLRRQSTPSVDTVIENNLMRELGLAIDNAIMQGSGSSGQPTGIFATASVPTSTISSAGAPTRVELLEFETDVAAGNGLNGNLAFVTTSAVKAAMKATAVDSGSGLFLCSDDNTALGYNVYTANHLTANRIIFGNFQDVYVGLWGGSDIVIDEATKAASGGVVMRVFQDVDVAVKHAASFSINA
jgi:HK97 family phage major capsid protein